MVVACLIRQIATRDGLFAPQAERQTAVAARFLGVAEALSALDAMPRSDQELVKAARKRLTQIAARGYSLEGGRMTASRVGGGLDFRVEAPEPPS